MNWIKFGLSFTGFGITFMIFLYFSDAFCSYNPIYLCQRDTGCVGSLYMCLTDTEAVLEAYISVQQTQRLCWSLIYLCDRHTGSV